MFIRGLKSLSFFVSRAPYSRFCWTFLQVFSKRYNMKFQPTDSSSVGSATNDGADQELSDEEEYLDSVDDTFMDSVNDSVTQSSDRSEEYVRSIQIELSEPLSLQQHTELLEELILPLTPSSSGSHLFSAEASPAAENKDAPNVFQ